MRIKVTFEIEIPETDLCAALDAAQEAALACAYDLDAPRGEAAQAAISATVEEVAS